MQIQTQQHTSNTQHNVLLLSFKEQLSWSSSSLSSTMSKESSNDSIHSHNNNNDHDDTDDEDNKKEESADFEFEGCEKRLLILFSGNGDLRNIKLQKWKLMLNKAKCSILNIIHNDHCDAYLLSESSLFVFRNKIMIKTCGTTTTLLILETLEKECKMIGLRILNLFYSRSNFLFPLAQPDMHRTFDNEMHFLNKHFNHKGDTAVLGSHDDGEGGSEKWHCYDLKMCNTIGKMQMNVKLKTLEIAMFGLNRNKMSHYFRSNLCVQNKDQNALNSYVTSECGIIGDLVPANAEIDGYMFDPCGFSLNALLNEYYWTIHITPEEHSSFVSFETNFVCEKYWDLIAKVVSRFDPQKFCFAVNEYGCDKNGNLGWNKEMCRISGYNLIKKCFYSFSNANDHCVWWCCFEKI